MTTKLIIPNLAGVATQNLVEKIGGGNFQASYINWSRTMQLLREHAPGWEPRLVPNKDGDILWRAPVGGFLMICFVNENTRTEEIPQAVMDQRNAAIPWEKITARDITDTHRRGICLAAAMTFGLAYELWAKLPLESGFHHEEPEPRVQPPPPPKAPPTPPAQEAPKDSGEPSIGAMLTILGFEKEEALALFNNNTGRKFLNLRDAVARMTPDEKVKVSAALKAEIAMRGANSAADGVEV